MCPATSDAIPSDPSPPLAPPDLWETVFDSLPDLAAVIDQDHRFVRVNQALAQRLGLEPAQAVGRRCHELMHGLDHPPAHCPHARLLLDGQEHVAEVYEPRLGGYFLAHSAPLCDPKGRLRGNAQAGVHIWRDISARRAAQEALEWELTVSSALARLGQQLMASPLALSPLAHTVLDFAQGLTRSRRGMVSALDPVTHRLDTHTSADGNPFPFFPDPAGEVPGLWGHALSAGEAFFTNDPAGHPAALDDASASVPRGGFLAVPVALNDEVVGQIALCDPASPYQDRDLRAVERLARLFALAVQSLRGDAERDRLASQLRHSQKMEALGVLAGGIAHDFNNIMGSILGFTEMALGESRQGHSAEADLGNVLLACQRAKDLVSRLLSFSRPGLERRQPIKLRALVQETVKLLRATLPSTIALQPRLCDEQGYALADPVQMQQVLLNLCTNASQALDPRGGGEIMVVLEDVGPQRANLARLHGLAPGDFVRVVVGDNGQGMDQATQERIFEPFFTTKRGLGSGLGLSVVHGIVQAHGGGIKVTSAPGQGASFSVLIPKAPPQEAGRPAPEPSTALPRGQERVLVVDDEIPLLEVVSRMLGKLGYQVRAFSSSQEALAAFSAQPDAFDLLLTDQTMPGLTGEDLTRAVLALRPDLPVILCTGFSESLNQERALELGARLLLMKPLTRQQLAQGLREALQPRV